MKKDQGKLTVEEIKVWDAMGELLMIHNTIVKNDRHELDNADSGVKNSECLSVEKMRYLR